MSSVCVLYIIKIYGLRVLLRGVNGQIPGANQDLKWQEVALQKQMHMSVAM